MVTAFGISAILSYDTHRQIVSTNKSTSILTDQRFALSQTDTDLIVHNLVGPSGRWWRDDNEMLRYGDRAFPYYKAVLSDDSRRNSWPRMYTLIWATKGDKRMFRDNVLEHINDEWGHCRLFATETLHQACPDCYAPLAIALLTDPHWPVARSAAKLLSQHGGENELTAFDTWLRTHDGYMKTQRSEEFEKMVRGYRDELYVRSRHR